MPNKHHTKNRQQRRAQSAQKRIPVEQQSESIEDQMVQHSDVWLINMIRCGQTPPALLRAAQYEAYRRVDIAIRNRYQSREAQMAPIEVDDVIQFVAAALFGNISKIQGTSIGSWACAAAKNHIVSIARLQSFQRRAAQLDPSNSMVSERAHGMDPALAAQNQEFDINFQQAVDSLDEVHSNCLKLWLAGIPPVDAAGQLGIKVRTCQRRTQRAIKMVMKRLGYSS